MRIIWSTVSWDNYLYWQQVHSKIVKRINILIKISSCSPFEGIGKPEVLKGDLQWYWSRRINTEHRLVYKFDKDYLFIAVCRYHYGKCLKN